MAERQFGPYRLVRQVAVGGMAEIHLAKTRGIAGFEKYVALKMIHPNFASDDQFIQMLIDEAKIAVQLQHVNVAQTFDLGRVGDTYYITMEFVDGADLYKILRRGSEQDMDMPLDVCAFIAKEAATGLDYAHRKKDVGGKSLGIVHRDVSPQNVLVSLAGEVKLVDFGIAKATMKARQTAVGVIKGKYYYMSPEQAWGDPLDHRSDIFSAGIVLYEMITGQMLYLEEDLHKLLDMVRRANIAPPSTLRQGVPPQLERIVMHALAKNANDRYQSAGDMASDLERFLHGYSPVFTASKLAAHLRKVLGDPVVAPAAPAAPEKRNPNLSTQPIERGELVRDHSEFTDENSVIFRVDELREKDQASGAPSQDSVDFDETAPTSDELPRAPTRAPTARPAPQRPPTNRPVPQPAPLSPPRRPPTQPPPVKIPPLRVTAAPPSRPVRIDEPTMQVTEADLADIEEMTMVTAPPGFGGAEVRDKDPRGGLAELGDYEPTTVDGTPEAPHDDEGPTTTRDPRLPLARAADSGAQTAPVVAPAPPGRLRPAPPGAPAHPALSAKNPTPSVSELKRPKPSRRTPARGVPQAPGPSVLQAIVSAQNSEPMPTRQLRSVSDGVPAQPLADHASSSSMTNPEAGRGAVPTQLPGMQPMPQPMPQPQPGYPMPPGWPDPNAPPPGANVLPQQPMYPQPYPQLPSQMTVPHNQLPPHLQPYAMQQQPGMQPGAQYPFLPYPSQPQTFTKQLAALEADEVPPHLRLDRDRPNWALRVLLAAALIGGAIATALLIVRSQGEPPPHTSLYIESVPPGAAVLVDGTQLPQPTPVRFDTKPGARHKVEVRLAGHKPSVADELVPEAGGEVDVKRFLEAIAVSLHVTSTPSGADVFFNGDLDHPQGHTPLDLGSLDPTAVHEVDVRLAGYAPEARPVDFGKSTDVRVEVSLHK